MTRPESHKKEPFGKRAKSFPSLQNNITCFILLHLRGENQQLKLCTHRSLSDAEIALLKKGLNYATNIPATKIITKVKTAIKQLNTEQADTVRRAVNSILQQAEPLEPNHSLFHKTNFALVAKLGQVKSVKKSELRQALRTKVNSMKFSVQPRIFCGVKRNLLWPP
ncbi:unnamed protein product [Pocillopora meandrina]|uniref:Uncharacterized protein n=1 Tax=Pocillopora meandrina TaxID=46732 RepID=A0AAU9XQK7_9CNID|nr:unnamed protein product [Pocillopora meandrina]